MSKLKALIARAKVILTASITFVLVVTPILVRLEGELGQLPGGFVSPTVTQWLARVVTVLVAVVGLVSTHTPVPKEQRGILPADPPLPSPRGDA